MPLLGDYGLNIEVTSGDELEVSGRAEMASKSHRRVECSANGLERGEY